MSTTLIRHGFPQLLALFAAAAASLWLCGCQPASSFFEVASSSMAPTLLGPTLQADCPYCQRAFPVAAETYRPEIPTRCNQCGGHCRVSRELSQGTRVRLLPLPATSPLERFELVAFEDRTSGAMHVKRIWGEPGEGLTLRDGEVYIVSPDADGPRLLQKSLPQLMQLCVTVSNFPNDTASHWYLATEGVAPTTLDSNAEPAAGIEQWHRVEDVAGGRRSAGPLALADNQTLQWRCQRPAPVHTASDHANAVPPKQWLRPSPLVDDYEVNQGVSCQLHQVDDYLLSLRLPTPLTGELQILWRHGNSVLPIVFHRPIGRQAEAPEPNGSTSPQDQSDRGRAPLRFAASQKIVVAWCDQRLLVETDLKTIALDASAVQAAFQAVSAEDALHLDSSAMLQIRSSHGLRVAKMVVARDLYFEDWEPPSTETDGYFVMGDNLPVSSDSRGGLGRIAREQVVGQVQP